jgi:radical SAM protein with 4Fe4S-binding SPASM domain
MKLLSLLQSRLGQRRSTSPACAPGLYHYIRQTEFERARVHLRIDPDGSGLLLVNANRVIHLNPTAALMAHLALEDTPPSAALQTITRTYDVTLDQARNDYTSIQYQLNELTRPDGACPVHDLNIETIMPFSARPSAPYRMDLALTYRCNNDCAHCYNDRPRTFPEMTIDQWKQVLDRVWAQGIPHVVFTGGEPTLVESLPELIAHAEHNGQITGLNTNARRLSDGTFVKRLVDAGLDHVQITVESHLPEVHDQMVRSRGAWKQTIAGLRNVLDTPLYVMTNTTMLRENSPYLEDTLNYLGELGVPTIGLNALIYSGNGASVGTGLDEQELHPLLEIARERTDAYHQRLIWYTPTEYCHFDPMQLELGVKGCTAALYNMCIEPNGAVLPCQSYYRPVGNMLSDPWDAIWNHPLSISLRERKDIPQKCNGCPMLPECGGGCPLKYDHL